MSYMALYRKFRPSAFDEVKGQDHIVTTLKNQLEAGRIGHAEPGEPERRRSQSCSPKQ